MRVFHGPFVPDKPKVPEPEVEETAERKAQDEAARRARAALAGGGRQASLLAGNTLGGGRTRARSLLGGG